MSDDWVLINDAMSSPASYPGFSSRSVPVSQRVGPFCPCLHSLNKPPAADLEENRVTLSHYWPSGAIRTGSPRMKIKKGARISQQDWFIRLQMAQFESTKH